MNFPPNPLHPAVVHFPIVLLLLGAVVAIAAVFVRKHGVPALAAILLVMGAVGTWGAVESGESDGGLVENTAPQVNDLLNAHETWAKRTMTISIIAGLAAVGSVLAARWPRTARAVRGHRAASTEPPAANAAKMLIAKVRFAQVSWASTKSFT